MSQIMQTQVHLDGLMDILSQHLYSSPVVVLRELVQNAHDSITRRQLESAEPFEPAIAIYVNRDTRQLIFEDNGSGLTQSEIIQYLATVGRGYTRELRQSQQNLDLIGFFGVGFLTAFVVSELVEVHTTSFQEPHRGWLYRSRDIRSFSLEEAPPRPVGTRVTLTLKADSDRLRDIHFVQQALRNFCPLLGMPLRVNAIDLFADRPPVPWGAAAQALSAPARRQAMSDLVHYFHGQNPLLVIPVQGGKARDLNGFLWVQGGHSLASDDNRSVRVFVRGMLISDSDINLLPEWAGFVGAVIESPHLVPTASREAIQKTPEYDAVRADLRQTLSDGLRNLASENPTAWQQLLDSHSHGLMRMMLNDLRMFEFLQDSIKLPTSQGLLTLPEIVSRGGNTLYLADDHTSPIHALIYTAQTTPLVQMSYFGVKALCLRYAAAKGVTVVDLKASNIGTLLHADPSREPADLTLFEALGDGEMKLHWARFSPASIPLVVVKNDDYYLKSALTERQRSGALKQSVQALADLYTSRVDTSYRAALYLNAANPLVERALASDAERADCLALLRMALAHACAQDPQLGGAGDAMERANLAALALLDSRR